MAFKNEAAFSRRFVLLLQQSIRLVQRIESGETGRGIPDIYLRGMAYEAWVELKNDPRQSIKASTYTIKWRAGQQAWHYKYWKACSHPVYTVVAMKDGYLIIPLKRRFIHNIVPDEECYVYTTLPDVVRWLRARID